MAVVYASLTLLRALALHCLHGRTTARIGCAGQSGRRRTAGPAGRTKKRRASLPGAVLYRCHPWLASPYLFGVSWLPDVEIDEVFLPI